MDIEEFRKQAKRTIDYICTYKNDIRSRRVIPGEEIKVGYLKPLISADAPEYGEKFEKIMEDFESAIMPGMVHWNHPRFHAYFASGDSFPSLLADFLSSAIAPVGFSWRSAPALTELELVVMNMYGRALDLPIHFLSDEPGSNGGGAMQGSASDAIFAALLVARYRAVKKLQGDNHFLDESIFLPSLVAYTSREAHSSVQKAAKMAIIKLRVLPVDEKGCLRGETVAEAIRNDVAAGLVPVFVSCTVGTTGTCAFDKLKEIGEVCKQYPSVWFHVDGAYGGNSFLLPEMRHFKEGLEYADSFNCNANKFLLCSFDSSCLWVRSVSDLKNAFVVTPVYLEQDKDPDYDGEQLRHYGIPLSRRFRALKLWFVLRTYGISGLQAYMRNHIKLAKRFMSHVLADKRFRHVGETHLGLVVFRLNVDASTSIGDKVNIELLERLNKSGEIHMIPTSFDKEYVIRFCVTNEHASEDDIDAAWQIIQRHTTETLRDYELGKLKFQRTDSSRELPSSLPERRRFAFVRSVSRDVYDQNHLNTALKDGSTPVVIVDEDDIAASFQRATIENNRNSSGMDTDVSN